MSHPVSCWICRVCLSYFVDQRDAGAHLAQCGHPIERFLCWAVRAS